MYLMPRDYPPVTGQPDNSDMAWLWFRPGSGSQDTLYPAHNAYCKRCDCFGVIPPTVEVPRCWNCGRYVERPKEGWSPNYYRPTHYTSMSGPPPITPTNQSQQTLEEL